MREQQRDSQEDRLLFFCKEVRMEENRRPNSQPVIKTAISNMRRSGKYSEEIIQLVSDDLNFGLTTEETDRYLRKGFDISQMRVVSQCLREGYSEEVIGILAKEGRNGQQMGMALEFFEKGLSLEQIEEVMNEDVVAYVMKSAYQNILEKLNGVSPEEVEEPEYIKSLLTEIKGVVSKIEYQEKRYDALNEKLKIFESTKKDEEVRDGLVRSLSLKDQMLSDQQDNINQANTTIARLRNELEDKEKEIKKVQNQMNELEENIAVKQSKTMDESVHQSPKATRTFADEDSVQSSSVEKESQNNVLRQKEVTPTSKIPYVYGIPTFYQASFLDGKGNVVQTPPVEKEEKKTSGVISLISKLGMKKKSKQDIVKLVANGELIPEQLVQIRIAMEKGLTEKQLVKLINSKVPAGHMKEIIEIAVLENSLD